ncbi:MAG: hypothetical protein JWM98_1310 [Thermoleophilia bacterium]|nr:hypothetical protein [Thermoleophilia bacterium]
MKPFVLLPASGEAEAAASVAADPGARFIAGGTTLVDLMKLQVETPGTLVDITRLGLGEIEDIEGGGVRIGATVRNSDLANDPRVRERWPVLSEALLAGASPQLRNMATVGGNLLQRARCNYFRDVTAACNKRSPGTGCDALEGHHRGHAVLGGSDACFATSPGDMPVALVALEATVETLRADGSTRSIPIGDLYVPYGDDPAREHVLAHGELVTGVVLAPSAWAARSTYAKARDRASYEFALASAAVALELDGGVIRTARVALGGVGTKPWRSTEAEAVLVGDEATDAVFEAAARAALADARPRRDNGFKVELAQRTIIRALRTLRERAVEEAA